MLSPDSGSGSPRGERGLTLIELLVALSVGLLVAMAAYDLLVGSSHAYKKQNDLVTAQTTGRAVLDLVGEDIRHAGLSPNGARFLAVPAGDANRIRVQNDANGNTIVAGTTDPTETVSYRFVGPAADSSYSLERGIDLDGDWAFSGTGESVQTIATDLVAVDINRDGNNEPFFGYAWAPPATSRVTVTFGVRSQYRDTLKHVSEVLSFQDSIALRNLR